MVNKLLNCRAELQSTRSRIILAIPPREIVTDKVVSTEWSLRRISAILKASMLKDLNRLE
jgi:hypothetical protein